MLIYPEGARGDASDRLQPLKTGVARLAAAFPEAPVIPAWIPGAGRVLPKDETVPAPMNCSVHVGPALRWSGDKAAFTEEVREATERLHAQAPRLRWAEEQEQQTPVIPDGR